MNDNKNEILFDQFKFPSTDDWKRAAEKALKGASFDKLMFTNTYEGLTLNPIYNLEDYQHLDPLRNQFPGFLPYLRHSDVNGFKENGWEIAQNLSYPLPEQFNTSLKKDLLYGQNSIKIYFDKAVSIYEDCDVEDVSNVDVLINDLEDLSAAFSEIDLNKFPINIFAGLATLPAAAALFSYLIKNSYNPANISGSINFDIFSDLITDGYMVKKMDSMLDELAILFKWAINNAPNFKLILIDSSPVHNAGANSAQELAFSFSSAVYYINALMKRGIRVGDISERISFNFSVGVNFFMEISKLRAARLIWAKILSAYELDEQNISIHLTAETSLRDSTYYDVYVNMLRSTTETFSAIMGGANSITVRNFDELHSTAGDFSRRTARNVQNVLKYESHLCDTIDPAGGSWYIESLTYELAKKSWEKFSEIEQSGGIIENLKSGSFQNNIKEIADLRQKNVANRKDIILGTNKYPNMKDKPINNNMNVGIEELENLFVQYEKRLKNRNETLIDSILDNFENEFIQSNAESFSTAIDSITNGATLAELYNSIPCEIEEVSITPLLTRRTAEIVELLRINADNYRVMNGKYPSLQIVCFGTLKEYKARYDFASDLMIVGGFENKIIDDNYTAQDALAKIDGTKEDIFVICSTDDIYTRLVPEFASELKKMNNKNYIILAGYPKEKVDEYQNAGVDMFIHIKSNIVEVLNNLQHIAGLSTNSDLEN